MFSRTFQLLHKSITISTVLLVLLPTTLFAAANTTDQMSELVQLVQANKAADAYALAVKMSPAHAGEPDFDFYYGFAALKSGHAGEAAFAFERVLMANPGNGQARLGLAEALFAQQEDLRSQQEFQAVLAQNPPANVVDIAHNYLAAIDRRASRYRTTITGYFELAGGHDNNVNRAPSMGSIPLGSGTLILGKGEQEESAAFLQPSAGVQVDRPLRPGLNLILGLDGQANSYQHTSEYSTIQGSGRVGLRWSNGPQNLTGYIQGQRFTVDNHAYLNSTGLNTTYRYRLEQDLSLHVDASLSKLNYDQLSALDSRLSTLGIGFDKGWHVAWFPQLSVTVMGGNEDPEDNSQQARALASRRLVGADLGMAIAPAQDWTSTLQAYYRRSTYEEATFPFPNAKKENYYSARLATYWHPGPHWQLGPYISYENNDSNIALYSFERTQVGLDARYNFF
jgi:hypothetical protein